ncbi:MAG TPA: LIM domain-containing protein, partial [candidate division Zixibacteria bacterium]|nr:LIM domain-containing protein [candidate division Zixibacteria bacterium]
MTLKHAIIAVSRLFLALSVLVIFLIPISASAQQYCAGCHKEIKGSWLEVDGKYYHPEHFVCSNCLKPISDPNFFFQNNKYYDSTCFATFISKRCAYCGKPIIGEIIYFESRVYHASCYNESVGKRCVVCGEVVMEEFFVDYKNNAVCKIHKDQAKRCHACHQFLSPEFNGSWQEFKDGRIICADCDATAVHEIKDARALAKEIQNELVGIGIEIDQDFTLT